MKDFFVSHGDRLKFVAPPALAAIADAALTLHGQVDAYWHDDGHAIEEVNPIGYLFLSLSPSAFIIAIAFWIIAVLRCHRHSSRVRRQVDVVRNFSIAFFSGACTWLIQFDYGIVWVVVACVSVRIILNPIYFVGRERTFDRAVES